MLAKAFLLSLVLFLAFATPSLAWTQHVRYCHLSEGGYQLVDVNVDQFNYQQNHTQDVIPPFDSEHGHFPELNLTEDNKELLANRCQPVKEDECEAPVVQPATESARVVVPDSVTADDNDKDTPCEVPPSPQPTPPPTPQPTPPPTPQPTPPVVTSPSPAPQPQVPGTAMVLPDTASSSFPNPILMLLVSLGLVTGFGVKRLGRRLNAARS